MALDTILDYAQKWEAETPDRLWLTQPMGGGQIRTFTWKQGLDEARRMAAHLKTLGLPEKSQIALFSKNSAWWILADLAIAMSGHITVPIYPTLTPDIIRYVIDHADLPHPDALVRANAIVSSWSSIECDNGLLC